MANIEKANQQRNAGRELTDEEIEMVAGGFKNTFLMHGGFLQTLDGLLDIIVGHSTNNQELIFEGLVDLGLRKSA